VERKSQGFVNNILFQTGQAQVTLRNFGLAPNQAAS